MKLIKIIIAFTIVPTVVITFSTTRLRAPQDNDIEMQLQMKMEQNHTHNRTVPCSERLKDIKPLEKPHVDGAITSITLSDAENSRNNSYIINRAKINCEQGFVGEYPCENVNLLSMLDTSALNYAMPDSDLEHVDNYMNDVWGWTDQHSKREFAIVGMMRGTAFVEITNPTNPIYLGVLPAHVSGSSMWRDIKTYKKYAYVVSEQYGHGMQIFDLTELLDANPSSVFEETGHYDGFGNAHNLFINEETGNAYAVGTNECNAGLYIMELKTDSDSSDDDEEEHAEIKKDKKKNKKSKKKKKGSSSSDDEEMDFVEFQACFGDDGYVHDVQCVVYHGADDWYLGREICFACNENTVTIIDVSDHDEMYIISSITYDDHQYTHQGWLTEDHNYFIFADELDERNLKTKTKTMVLNVQTLENPTFVGLHYGTTRAIDHNQYIVHDLVYQANYQAGFQLLQMNDLDTAEFSQVAHFDVFKDSDVAEFNGAFSVYPFFKSKSVIVTGIEQGLFILEVDLPDYFPATDTPSSNASPSIPTAAPTKGQYCQEKNSFCNGPSECCSKKCKKRKCK